MAVVGRHGIRTELASAPASVRAAIDEIAGSPVVAATNQAGGFSPGPACRCDLADGRTVFVKAAGTELNPDSPQIHRREADVLRALPADHPSPTLIDLVDDGDWVALVIEWIDLLALLPALRLDGGPHPGEIFDRHPVGRTADRDAATAMLAAIAGCLTRRSLQPPPLGLPTFRAFQAAQGEIARAWLAERL